MELSYRGQRATIDPTRYPELKTDLAFLHTYAAETWRKVTGERQPVTRLQLESTINELPRVIDNAASEKVAEQKLNSFFAQGLLLWPFGAQAAAVKKLKEEDQSHGLLQLLNHLDPSAISPGQAELIERTHNLKEGASRQLEIKLDDYRIEQSAYIENIRQRLEAAHEILRRAASERIDRLEKILTESEARRSQDSEEQKLGTLRWIEERQGELKALANDITARSDALKDQVDKWQAEKDSEIANTKEAYRISFATQKAHEYWATTKYDRHTKLAKKSFWAGIIYICLVLGGAAAFVALGSGFFNQPIWQTPLALALPLAIAVVAFIWLGRLLARTYMAHVQLAEDAQERATMIETYIALISAGVLDSSKADEAQKALFRPASIGLLAGDSGPDTPIEVVSKALSGPR